MVRGRRDPRASRCLCNHSPPHRAWPRPENILSFPETSARPSAWNRASVKRSGHFFPSESVSQSMKPVGGIAHRCVITNALKEHSAYSVQEHLIRGGCHPIAIIAHAAQCCGARRARRVAWKHFSSTRENLSHQVLRTSQETLRRRIQSSRACSSKRMRRALSLT